MTSSKLPTSILSLLGSLQTRRQSALLNLPNQLVAIQLGMRLLLGVGMGCERVKTRLLLYLFEWRILQYGLMGWNTDGCLRTHDCFRKNKCFQSLPFQTCVLKKNIPSAVRFHFVKKIKKKNWSVHRGRSVSPFFFSAVLAKCFSLSFKKKTKHSGPGGTFGP